MSSNVTTRWWCQNTHILNSQSYRFIPPSQDVSSSRSFIMKNARWSLVMIASRDPKKSPHRARYITNQNKALLLGHHARLPYICIVWFPKKKPGNLILVPSTTSFLMDVWWFPTIFQLMVWFIIQLKRCHVKKWFFGVPGWSLYKPTPAASWDCSTLAASLGVPEFGEEFWMLKRSPLKLWNHMKLWIL